MPLTERNKREIKFRGLAADGQWHYGMMLYNKVGIFIVTEENPHVCSQYGYIEIDEFENVIPETVGQYTGIKDFKRTKEFPEGEEIYEGAILRFKDYYTGWNPASAKTDSKWDEFGEIYWDDPGNPNQIAAFLCKTLVREEGVVGNPITRWEFHRVEIIGSIYENPELLTEGKS